MPTVRWRTGLVVAATVTVMAVAACAGGDSSGIGSGGSGTTTDQLAGSPPPSAPTPAPVPVPSAAPVPGVGVGSIAGFGSIVVNGVAWDETRAAITGDDGGPSDRSMLLLGRRVSVTGTIDPVSGRGTAATVALRRALVGVVERFDSNGRPVVLGLPVGTDVGTTWATPLKAVSSIRLGDRVEVYGVVAADNTLVRASRVESGSARLSLREGVVSSTRSDRCGFALGTLTVDCSHAASAPQGAIANGSRVRVAAARDASNGTLIVDRVDLLSAPLVATGTRIGAEGRIAAITGTQVVVDGWTFDVSNAAFSNPPPGGLAVGTEVEISGVARADGTVAAIKVKVETDDETQGREFEATGTISAWAGRSSFVVRSVKIDASVAKISGGNVNALGNGVMVAVHGRLVDGVVIASELEIKD